MRSHSFLVDYRDEHSDSIADETERSKIYEYMVDSDESVIVVG